MIKEKLTCWLPDCPGYLAHLYFDLYIHLNPLLTSPPSCHPSTSYKPITFVSRPRNSSRIRFLLFRFLYYTLPRKTGVCCVFSSRFLCSISIVFVLLFVPPLYFKNVKCELLVCVPLPPTFPWSCLYTQRPFLDSIFSLVCLS